MRQQTPMPGPACGHDRHGVIRFFPGRTHPVCTDPHCVATLISAAAEGAVGVYQPEPAAA